MYPSIAACHLEYIPEYRYEYLSATQLLSILFCSLGYNGLSPGVNIGITVNDKALRKHAYSNILKIIPLKKIKFSNKNSDILHISAQHIGCGYALEPPRQGDSNAYPQPMF